MKLKSMKGQLPPSLASQNKQVTDEGMPTANRTLIRSLFRHTCQSVDALSSVPEHAPAHSILGDDMPVRSDNADGPQPTIKYLPLGFWASLSSVGFG